MTDENDPKQQRVRAILADLLKRRLAESLSEVDAALGLWKSGELSVFEAHGEILGHVGRAEAVAEQVGEARGDAGPLLRQAFDAGIVSRNEFIGLIGDEPENIEPAPRDSGMVGTLPAKSDVALELIGNGPILVHIDARVDAASVPASFSGDARLVLRFGYQLSPAIADLDIDDEGISGTLTFGGKPHRCIVPWTSVYAIVGEDDQRGMVWPEDVPTAALGDFGAADKSASATGKPDGQATEQAEPAPRLRAASQSELDLRDAGWDGDPSSMPTPDEVKRGAHLKLIK